jgi:hypothetical protein
MANGIRTGLKITPCDRLGVPIGSTQSAIPLPTYLAAPPSMFKQIPLTNLALS